MTDPHDNIPRRTPRHGKGAAKKRIIALLIASVLLIAGVVAAVLLCRNRPVPISDLQSVSPPEGTQLLFFPIEDGLITAGYRNQSYQERKGYPHYGIDLTVAGGGTADILAAGDGIVLGTEFCDNNLGFIAVIRHDNVLIPQTGKTISLIGRYYHMTTLQIREGDTVTAGQRIGAIDRSHEWYNHIHLELDADVAYPFHTPQVSEASSELLLRFPADGEQMIEPLWVLVVRNGQRIAVSSTSKSVTEKDKPQYSQP